MRGRRVLFVVVACALAGTVGFGQPGRGGSQWLTSRADAQRTSWVRTDAKISVGALSKPGFELQWKAKLDNQPRGQHGLGPGVTASGVTLFVPMSIVTGGSNNVYAIDNDIGHVVWQRRFTAALPAATPACPGGITSGATRIVSLGPSATAPAAGLTFGGGAVGYRSLLGEPGEGVPTETGAAGRRGAGGDPSGAAAPAGRGAARGGPPPPPPSAGRGNQAESRIPGAPRSEEAGPYGMLFRPSGVSYVVSSDGMLHVLGLQSGKDLQRPAAFLPANSRWSAPIAVDTTLYAATSGNCGGAPSGVWGIDLDSDAKPVVSWKTGGGDVVGDIAFTSDGLLIAAIGRSQPTGEGKANAIVALDPKTLQLKDWFTQPTAEFVTGPTILRHNGKDIVAAATKDGRVLLLDAASLGGANHATPLAASKPLLDKDATVSDAALATWQQSSAPGAAVESTWILVPVAGRLAAGGPATNGAITGGSVVALKLEDAGGALSLTPAWSSSNLVSPATPIVVNGVVFAVATGRSLRATGSGTPAVVHAYDGSTGKPLWNSGKAMSTFASPGSVWSGLGQIYIGTHDGTLHAFGFGDERHATGGR